jgi:flagellar motor protein MotB
VYIRFGFYFTGSVNQSGAEMPESNRPFTDHVTKSKGGSGLGWIVAVFMALAAMVFLVLWFPLRTSRQELDSLGTKLDEVTGSLSNALAENYANQGQIAELKSQVAELEQEKRQAGQAARGLEAEMRAGLESKDVTISQLRGKLTVNILDRVMFDSGEAVLKPGGEAVMWKIANLLAQHPELKIHVIGHTDNVPIRAEAHSRFASNWELSTARALAALHFLVEKAGVDPRRVGAVGYGEYRPLADNTTVEGRAKNRRIAIAILPDELAIADVIGARPDVSTNSLPNSPGLDAPTQSPAQ